LEAFKHKDFIVISSESSTQHGDPLGVVLFALAHFRALHSIATTHLTCVFPSLANDTHMIGPTLDVLPIFCNYRKNLEHYDF
jgi:hypothetical protein